MTDFIRQTLLLRTYCMINIEGQFPVRCGFCKKLHMYAYEATDWLLIQHNSIHLFIIFCYLTIIATGNNKIGNNYTLDISFNRLNRPQIGLVLKLDMTSLMMLYVTVFPKLETTITRAKMKRYRLYQIRIFTPRSQYTHSCRCSSNWLYHDKIAHYENNWSLMKLKLNEDSVIITDAVRMEAIQIYSNTELSVFNKHTHYVIRHRYWCCIKS